MVFCISVTAVSATSARNTKAWLLARLTPRVVSVLRICVSRAARCCLAKLSSSTPTPTSAEAPVSASNNKLVRTSLRWRPTRGEALLGSDMS